MKRARPVIAVIALVFALVAAVAAPVLVSALSPLVRAAHAGREHEEAWESATRRAPPGWREDVDAVLADGPLWALLMPPRTRDAAAYLDDKVAWTGAASSPSGGALPRLPAATEAALAGDDPFAHADDIPLEGVDTTWMKPLPGFSHWRVDRGDPALPPALAPRPALLPLLRAAQVRLAEGLVRGGFDDAEAEVRALARLCWSTDSLLGGVVAAAILEDDARARQAAAARGLVPAARALASVAKLRKVVMSSTALYQLLTPESFSPFEKSDLRFCGAVAEGAAGFLVGKSVFDETDPVRAAAIAAAVRDSPCELARVRRAWSAGSGELVDDLPGRRLPRALVGGWLRDALVPAAVPLSPAGHFGPPVSSPDTR